MEINTELDINSPAKKTDDLLPDQFPNKNYYQALFEGAPIGVVVADSDGVFLRVNEAACNMLGYSEEELLGLNLKKISHPDDMKTNMTLRRKLIAGDIETFKMQKRYIHKDGHIVWGKLTGTTLEGLDDDRSYLLAHLEDITEQKKSEQAFLEIENRYQTLFMDSPLSMWEIDMSEIKSYINNLIDNDVRNLDKYFQNNLEEAVDQVQKLKVTNVNKATLNLYKAKSKDDFDGKLKNLLNKKSLSAFLVELINSTKGISEMTLQLPITDLMGNEMEIIVGMFVAEEHEETWSRVLCTNIDVTKQIKDEAALRETEDKYKKLLEIANDAIFVVDAATGKITEANKKATSIIGASRQKVIGSTFFDHLKNESPDSNIDDLKRIIESEGGFIQEATIKTSKQESIPVELSSSIVKIGKKKFIQNIARDVSDRYRAKELGKALDNINQAIHSTLDFNEMMERLVREACETLGDTVGILIRDDRYWIAEYFEGSLAHLKGTHFTEDEIKAATIAENTLSPVVSNDTQNDDRFNSELMEISNMKSLLLVPLLIKDQVIGGLCFAYSEEAVPFNDVEVDFGVKLGATVGLAIENARMYGSEHQIAETLQEALLIMPQTIKGVEFGHLYESSTEIAKVGGDFFDLFEADNQYVGMLIGDVSGKGLSAATLTAMVKNSVRAYVEIEKSPSSIVGMASDLIRKTNSESMYVSIFFGLLNRKTGNLKYCCAGHPPPIIRHATDRDTFFLDSTSTVIGQFSDIYYEESEITLLENDLLFAYTDGLTEVRSNDDFFGESRLSKLILKNKNLKTRDLPKVIFREAKNFAGGKLHDDIAILTISPKKY